MRATNSAAHRLSAVRRLEALLEELRPGVRKEERLVFKENGRVIFVRTESLDWIEADGNYVRLHAGNESHYVRGTLAKLEAQLRRPTSCGLAARRS